MTIARDSVGQQPLGGERATLRVSKNVTPTVMVTGAAKAIALYRTVFDAELITKQDGVGTAVRHAELQFGGGRLVVGDPEAYPAVASAASGYSFDDEAETGVGLRVDVSDVDAAFQRAVMGGMEVLAPPADAGRGGRAARVRDPFGLVWELVLVPSAGRLPGMDPAR